MTLITRFTKADRNYMLSLDKHFWSLFWCSLGAVKHMVIFLGILFVSCTSQKHSKLFTANLLHPFQGVLGISVGYVVKCLVFPKTFILLADCFDWCVHSEIHDNFNSILKNWNDFVVNADIVLYWFSKDF